MRFSSPAALVLALGVAGVHALPAAVVDLVERASVTALTTAQINAFTPYTWYASAGYCKPAATLAWNCGSNCNANPGFIPVASGGDGVITQFWYVGYDPKLNTVIVSHQGTDTEKILPVITDANFFLHTFDATLFPGLSTAIQGHDGFLDTHARSAPAVLAAVKTALTKYKTTSVTTVGHSLGAAISLLDAIYLPLFLPASTTFKTYTYGMPRVGNQAFADFVDSAASKVHLVHINNKEDAVPILPGRFLGFHHPSGEVHIDDPTSVWYNCPGQDNTSDLCEVGDATSIFDINADDHMGPYGPVTMGC